MPNTANVIAPINIHGTGRSGTTLLQNILGTTGFIQVCNETNQFLFAAYRAGEMLNASHDAEAPGGQERLAVRAVHAAFCAALPSGKPSWCQKVGGVPNAIVWEGLVTQDDLRFAAEPYAFPYEWFWRALSRLFPMSHDVLILRDYRDVVLSRSRFSGYEQVSTAQDLAVYLNLLAHPASRIDHVVPYEALVEIPEKTIAALFTHLGLTYMDIALQALAWHGAPTPGRSLGEMKASGFSWRAHHGTLTDEVHRVLAEPLHKLAARLGDEAARAAGQQG